MMPISGRVEAPPGFTSDPTRSVFDALSPGAGYGATPPLF
jgi:hypothetical protein